MLNEKTQRIQVMSGGKRMCLLIRYNGHYMTISVLPDYDVSHYMTISVLPDYDVSA